MYVEQVLDIVAEENGWHIQQKLSLCLEYINNQKDDSAFRDFLHTQARQEDMQPAPELPKKHSVQGVQDYIGQQTITGICSRYDSATGHQHVELQFDGLPSLHIAAVGAQSVQVYVERKTQYLATKIEKDVLIVWQKRKA